MSHQPPFLYHLTQDMPECPPKHCLAYFAELSDAPKYYIGHLKRVAKKNLQKLYFISRMQMPHEANVYFKLKERAIALSNGMECKFLAN